jgi:TPR repeat protein
MFSIGAMHWRGMTGKVDRKTAFEFFTRSSKVPRLGNEQAANVLAKVYFYGESHEKFGVKGIKKDVKKAAALCLQSAEWGFLPSIGTIAHFYDVGIGVEKDLVKALAWHKVTLQKHPHEHAKERIAALQKELTPEQLAASEKLAKEITAKIEARKPTKKTGI